MMNLQSKNIELLKKARNGNKEALNQFAANNIPLVISVAQKFNNRNYEFEDIFQVGCIGLLDSIKRFDFNKNFTFSTYAVPKIIGEIKKYFRDNTHNSLKVSRELKELSTHANYKSKELSNALGRKPTIEELANYIGCKKEKLVDAFRALSSNKSLEEIIFHGDSGITLQEALESDFNLEDKIIKRSELQHLYDCIEILTDIENKVIKLRLKEFTQVKTAEMLNINQVNVSRAEKRAVRKLKILMPEHTEIKLKKSIQMFKKGFINKDISNRLDLSLNIIEIYRTVYNKKLGISRKIKSNKKKEAFNLLQHGYKAKDLSSKLNITIGTAYGYTHQFKHLNI